jgi:hypothetical protein
MLNRKRQKTEERRQKAEGVRRRGAFWCVLLTCACVLFLTGCRMDMQDQPKVEAYEKGSIRKPVEGTVPRGYLREDKHLYTGKKDVPTATATPVAPPKIQSVVDQTPLKPFPPSVLYPDVVDTFPFPITEKIVKRGEERYNIFCGMCHGPTGYGDGMIVRRGFRRPPSYHTDQLRQAPVGHFFDVMTNGWGAMPSYAAMVPVTDRWAIVAYIRALQLSQKQTETPVANAPAATQRTETRGQR